MMKKVFWVSAIPILAMHGASAIPFSYSLNHLPLFKLINL